MKAAARLTDTAAFQLVKGTTVKTKRLVSNRVTR